MGSDGALAWSLPWIGGDAAEHAVELQGGAVVVTQQCLGCEHSFASLVRVSGTGTVEGTVAFTSSSWVQIHALRLGADGALVAGGMFQDTMVVDVLGTPRTFRGGYFAGFVARLDASLRRTEWVRDLGGRDTVVSSVLVQPDRSVSIMGSARDTVTAGAHTLTLHGVQRYWSHLDSKGQPTALKSLAAEDIDRLPLAGVASALPMFAHVANGVHVLDSLTGARMAFAPLLPEAWPSVRRVVDSADGTHQWILRPAEPGSEPAAIAAIEVSRVGSTGRTATLRPPTSPSDTLLFRDDADATFLLDAKERLWVRARVIGKRWDALPFAATWWSPLPLPDSAPIAGFTAGAAVEDGCATTRERRDRELFRAFSGRHWEEPYVACGLSHSLAKLEAVVLFADNGTVVDATLPPTIVEPQRSCITQILRTRRVCPGRQTRAVISVTR